MKVTMLGRSYAYANAPLSLPASPLGTSFYPYRSQMLGAEPWELGSQDTLTEITESINQAYQPGRVDWQTFVLNLMKVGGDTAAAIIAQKQAATTDARDSQLLQKLLDNLSQGRPLNADTGITFQKATPWLIGAGAVALVALVVLRKGRRRSRRR